MKGSIEIAKAGLNRFFDEGFARWPEDKLIMLSSNASLDSDEIRSHLTSWRDAGWIELPGRIDEYLRVLKAIPGAGN